MQPNFFVRTFCQPFCQSFCLFLLVALMPAVVAAQTRPAELPRDLRPRNCSVSGRVTINGQPAANVQLSIVEAPTNLESAQPIRQTADGSISRMSHKARTDGEGRYQLANLPPGRYLVLPGSKAFVASDASQRDGEPKTLTLDAGESQDNVNFSLVRGGIITGQVTDSEGRPAIAHSVQLYQVTAEADGRRQLQPHRGEFGEGMTDDRGIYRIYGLAAGNYAVGAGGENNFFSSEKYLPVFYPDAAEQSQAKIIEVSAGKEITDINLRLGATRKRYEAVGRVVEADTGKPVPNINVGGNKIRATQENGDGDNEGGGDSSQADRLGNFRLTGLSRGKYRASIYAGWMEPSEFYAEPTTFEIVDGNISGVEIKAVRGGTISGVSVIEGSNDAATKTKLTQTWVYAQIETAGQPGPFSHSRTTLKPDGTFLLTGIAPGKVALGVQPFGGRSLSLLRIERGGVEIKDNLEMTKGEQITDVRLIFSAGSGIIRGQVQTVGGQPLPNGWNSVGAKLAGNSTGAWFSAQIDEKGRFELNNLPSGEYELELNVLVPSGPGQTHRRTVDKQKVAVTSGAEVRVTLTYDPSRKEQEER